VKIYYEDEQVILYHGDAREIQEWTVADVLVTDPPYGLDSGLSRSSGRPGKRYTPVFEAPQWDTDLSARDKIMTMWGDKPYAVFGSPKRLDAALPCREVPLVWDKANVGMGDTTFPWGPGYELVYVNGDGWTGTRESAIIRVQHSAILPKREGHPTPKPIPLMEQIIRKAPPGIIADPFSGTGSTLVAARNLGRVAIGVEVEERYCLLAARRLSQMVLFSDEAMAAAELTALWEEDFR